VGGNVGGSQSWNRYSYARNNPIRMVDPDGREEGDVVVVDPGNGDRVGGAKYMDPGAVSGGFQEKNMALAVAKAVEASLKANGTIGILTRHGDIESDGLTRLTWNGCQVRSSVVMAGCRRPFRRRRGSRFWGCRPGCRWCGAWSS